MSDMCYTKFRCRLVALLSCACLFSLASTAAALTPPDESSNSLDSVKRLNEVAAQKTEAEIRLAVRTAQHLSAADPEKALQRLKDALAQVEDSRALSDDRKSSLKSMLKDRIRVTEAGLTSSKDDGDLDRKVRKAGQKGENEKLDGDKDEIRRLLDGIKMLQKEGKLGQARLQAGELASRFSGTPAAQAADKITSKSNQLADNRQLQAERERGTSGVMREVEASAIPPSGDIQFPKDWKERTKNRGTKPRLTAKEQAIVRGLNSIISVQFKDSRLEDVIEFLQTYIGQPIVLDPLAMDEVGVKYDTPVTLKLKSIILRTVLKKILRDLGLTYVVKDEMIQVTTPEQAKNMMVVRVYSVADLVRNRFEAAMLIDLIQSTMEPESWKANGGTGTIVYNPLTRSIVIKQNAEFHTSMGSLLP